MPAMNNQSLIKIMEILDISTTKLAEELFISQSLVSKWRSGSRTMKASSSQYQKLLNYFIKTNHEYNIATLEDFFHININEIEDNSQFNIQLAIRQALNNYMLSYNENKPQKISFLTDDIEKNFKAYMGMETRINIQKQFWDYLSKLDPKPDVYIKELNYGQWSSDPAEWLDKHHEDCINYMNSGGHIYYFSDLNIIEKRDYYSSWEFSSHKNLHPTYYKTILSEKIGWSYFIAKDCLSISYFYPENNPDKYYTAVHQDNETLEAHYNYIKTEYDKNNKTIVIDSNEKFNFAAEVCRLYKDDINPVFYVGKHAPYIFSTPKSLRQLLTENNIPKRKIKVCMDLHSFIRKEIFSNSNLKKQIFFYEEDLYQNQHDEKAIDITLTGMLNKPVFLSPENRQERLSTIKSMAEDKLYPNTTLHIVPKSNQFVYSALGEISSDIFVKYNKWCYTFDENGKEDVIMKIIQDPTACSIRYEMFDEILKKK